MADGNYFVSRVAAAIDNVLNRRGIRFTEIGIFGSRAAGKPLKTSDWDFYAVIAEPQGFLDFISISNEVSVLLGLPLTTSAECTFGKDKSRCIDFKFTDKRPPTGKPLIPAPRIEYDEPAENYMILKEEVE